MLGLGLRLGSVLGLGFVLVMYSAGQKYRWHILWIRALIFSAYHNTIYEYAMTEW